MICFECQENAVNAKKIGSYNYCNDCIYKYMLVKCPNRTCMEVVSLNGYDNSIDIDLMTCQQCNSVCCSACITKYSNTIICSECITNLNTDEFS